MSPANRKRLEAAGLLAPVVAKAAPGPVEAVGPKAKFNPFKRSKYKAKPTEYGGVRYSSMSEAKRAEDLDKLQSQGEILWWIGQPKFRLGCPENVYVADFLVVTTEGVRIEDVKGMETQKFKRDKKLWGKYGPTSLWLIKGKKVEIVEGANGLQAKETDE